MNGWPPPLRLTIPLALVAALALLRDTPIWFFAAALAFLLWLYLDRTMTRRALGENARTYRLLFTGTPLPAWVEDTETGRIIDANDAATRMYGYSREELCDLHKADLEAEEPFLPTLTGPHDPQTLMAQHARRDGEEILVELRSGEIELDGAAARVVVATDISERHAIEDALRRSERRLREAQRLGSTCHMDWVVQEDRLLLSEQAREILGLTAPEDDLGIEDFADRIHPDDKPGYLARRRALLEEGEIFEYTFRYRPPGGEERVLEKIAELTRRPDGEPLRVFAAIRDATRESAREEMLAHLHQQMDTVVRNLPGMIVRRVTHPDGSFEFPLVAGRLRERFDELAHEGKAPGLAIDRIHPDDRERVLEAFRGTGDEDSDTADETVSVEYRATANDGEQLCLRSIFDVERMPDGRIVSNGIVLDVTRERRAEEALRRTQKMEALGQLTGGIAHDFNNLLTVIIGNLGFLREYVQDAPDGEELLGIIGRAADRGAQLTRRLLEFAQKRPAQARPVQINRLIEEMDRLLKSTLGAMIERHYRLEPDLWPVLVDPAELEDALLNLAINARDAIQGEGNLTIATANQRLGSEYIAHTLEVDPGDYVMLTVSDDGGGIPPEVRERIFEPFFTTKEEGKGTGLGLSMVFGFVRRAEGDIEVRSEPGHGTTFRLLLPRARVSEGELRPERDALPEGDGELVLVVDDEAPLVALAGQMLSGLGYRVETATDPTEALERIRDPEDLVGLQLLFTDVVMPADLNGVALAHAAVRERPELTVLLTSGFVIESTLEKAREDWRRTLLTKPYDRRALAERVRDVLDEDDISE